MGTLARSLYKGTDRENENYPFIIAEMSGNHNASLERALQMVDIAADVGADAIKLQTFTPEAMTLDIKTGDFVVTAANSLWKGRDLFSLFSEGQTPREWHKPIFDRAAERGVLCFSSVFDRSAVDFLEALDAPAYKIASFECTDIPLIRYTAQTGKPMIISTGMAMLNEIADAVDAAREGGCDNLTLLACTSTYPASPKDTNLKSIPHMRDTFGCDIGLSDHTLGIGVAIGAAALGATVIEKHYTTARADGGIDSAFSLEPDEFRMMVKEVRAACDAVGEVSYGPTEAEMNARAKRRSLYICEDMKKGDKLTERNLRSIRPGRGLPPKFYDSLLGKAVSCDVAKGTPMSFELLG